MNPPRLAVLVSGAGRSLENLVVRERLGELGAHVALVLGSKPGLPALARAQALGVPAEVVRPEGISDRLDAQGIDFAVLAGYLRRWPIPPRHLGRAINIHPALLPLFGGAGFYGHRVHAAVLASGMRVSGCTVHFVSAEYDRGPIIGQRCVPVLPEDTEESLAARVFAAECELLPLCVRALAEGRVRQEGNRCVYVGPAP
jgi:phosphoribosylglycinamide formyltransferase-1